MRNSSFSLLLLIAIAYCGASCQSESKKTREVVYVKKENIVKGDIQVSGMTCVGCEVTIEEKLLHVKGVVSVKADYNLELVVVDFDSTKTDIDKISQFLGTTDYKPK